MHAKRETLLVKIHHYFYSTRAYLFYEFFSNDSIEISSTAQSFNLAPGEYRLYSTRKFDDPHVVTEIDDIRVQTQNISVYPNPATTEIYIKSQFPISQVQIYSLTGKKIAQSNSVQGNDKKINIEGFPPGIYLIKIFQQEKITTKKMMIN